MLHIFAPLFVTKIVIMPGIMPILVPQLNQKYFALCNILFIRHSLNFSNWPANVLFSDDTALQNQA